MEKKKGITLGRKTDHKHWEMLEEIDELGEGLTAWEIDFVESLMELQALHSEFKGTRYVLTRPQQVKIENIHERRVP